MKPRREIDYKRLLELFWEFSRKIEELHTLYLDAVVGFKLLHEQLRRHQDDVKRFLGEHEYATAAFQDTCSVAYQQLGDSDLSLISMSPVMKQGDVKERTREGGKNLLLLGSQCVVAAYAYWEEYLRIEIGIALGVLPQGATNSEENRAILNEHVTSDFWGDMRHLRNSILHKNGIANPDMSRCKIIRWCPPGTSIELTFERMQKIFLLMGAYRNELHSMSLPPRDAIRIPGPAR